jgi:hypothetical protein
MSRCAFATYMIFEGKAFLKLSLAGGEISCFARLVAYPDASTGRSAVLPVWLRILMHLQYPPTPHSLLGYEGISHVTCSFFALNTAAAEPTTNDANVAIICSRST